MIMLFLSMALGAYFIYEKLNLKKHLTIKFLLAFMVSLHNVNQYETMNLFVVIVSILISLSIFIVHLMPLKV